MSTASWERRRQAAGDPRDIARLVECMTGGGEPDRYAGKRSVQRITGCVQLEVTTDPADVRATTPVTMQDIAHTGLSFWSRSPVDRHGVVFVRLFDQGNPSPWLPVAVRHVTVGIRGYLIGGAFIVDETSGGQSPGCDGPALAHQGRRPAGAAPRRDPGPPAPAATNVPDRVRRRLHLRRQ